jgi:spore coat protein A, manganese oxidase
VTPAPRLGRRAFLGLIGGGALAVLLPSGLRPRSLLSMTDGVSRALAATRFKRRLPIPRVLEGAELQIPIRESAVQILPGRKTKMWTYAGDFPGPTIRRRAGQRTKVTFTHELPPDAGELSVHLHGGHSRSKFDGQPGGLTRSHRRSYYCDIPQGLSRKQSGNDVLIEPGERRTYVYDLKEDGRPERAAFQWYHDHRLDHTARNVWRGLAGMWIIDDGFDDSLPLPNGDRDIPLMISERSFDRDNQLTDPFTNRLPPNDGVLGEIVLLNGAYLPHHRVDARRYRLRILNASHFRSYNVALSHGLPLIQIATESGLMPKPVKRHSILLGPAERAELIADFGGVAGEKVELRSVPRPRRERALGTQPFLGPLMQFRVGERLPDHTRVPRKLRPLPRWAKHASETVDRRWEITIGGGFTTKWLINGRTFNPARADAFPVIGTTETWEFTNSTAVAHLIHLHHTDWYLLSRNGRPPPPWEDCLKETFFLDPHETIVVAGHFSDYLGKYVIHCHMLDHEDHGLMTQFEVVRGEKAPAEGP